MPSTGGRLRAIDNDSVCLIVALIVVNFTTITLATVTIDSWTFNRYETSTSTDTYTHYVGEYHIGADEDISYRFFVGGNDGLFRYKLVDDRVSLETTDWTEWVNAADYLVVASSKLISKSTLLIQHLNETTSVSNEYEYSIFPVKYTAIPIACDSESLQIKFLYSNKSVSPPSSGVSATLIGMGCTVNLTGDMMSIDTTMCPGLNLTQTVDILLSWGKIVSVVNTQRFELECFKEYTSLVIDNKREEYLGGRVDITGIPAGGHAHIYPSWSSTVDSELIGWEFKTWTGGKLHAGIFRYADAMVQANYIANPSSQPDSSGVGEFKLIHRFDMVVDSDGVHKHYLTTPVPILRGDFIGEFSKRGEVASNRMISYRCHADTACTQSSAYLSGGVQQPTHFYGGVVYDETFVVGGTISLGSVMMGRIPTLRAILRSPNSVGDKEFDNLESLNSPFMSFMTFKNATTNVTISEVKIGDSVRMDISLANHYKADFDIKVLRCTMNDMVIYENGQATTNRFNGLTKIAHGEYSVVFDMFTTLDSLGKDIIRSDFECSVETCAGLCAQSRRRRSIDDEGDSNRSSINGSILLY